MNCLLPDIFRFLDIFEDQSKNRYICDPNLELKKENPKLALINYRCLSELTAYLC
jgi:hypothetical protein